MSSSQETCSQTARPKHLGVEAVHLAKPASVQSSALLVPEFSGGRGLQYCIFSFEYPYNLQICISRCVLRLTKFTGYLSMLTAREGKDKPGLDLSPFAYSVCARD